MINIYGNIGAKDVNVVFADNVPLKKRMELGAILDQHEIDLHMDIIPCDKTTFYIDQSMPLWKRNIIEKHVTWMKIDAWLVVEQDNGFSYMKRI